MPTCDGDIARTELHRDLDLRGNGGAEDLEGAPEVEVSSRGRVQAFENAHGHVAPARDSRRRNGCCNGQTTCRWTTGAQDFLAEPLRSEELLTRVRVPLHLGRGHQPGARLLHPRRFPDGLVKPSSRVMKKA